MATSKEVRDTLNLTGVNFTQKLKGLSMEKLGLLGQDCYLRIPGIFAGNEVYPFGNKRVPVRIIQETPYHVTVRIMPHTSEKGETSSPYNVSLHKTGLLTGEYELSV